MKILKIVILLSYSFLGVSQSNVTVAVNLSLPTVALLDIESSNTAISLALQAPAEAGNAVTIPTNNTTKWLNFTSAVATGGSRRITAQITSVTIPSGLQLQLSAGSYSGSGAGTLGSAAPGIFLSGTAQNIVTGIGAGYTGTGNSNGYLLNYGLIINNYSQLRFNLSTTVTVTFTLTDN
jgi:hypothetical protein